MALPPLYARWLEELHGAPPPEEPRTTCQTCPMIRDRLAEHQFTRETKCCTFFPEMSSFSVGGVLLDEEPSMQEGRRRLRQRIADGQQVTPLGVTRPGVFLRLYGSGETFGKEPALRCPYYIEEGGNCGVWRHREATCATWFCKHEHGILGHQFWTEQRRLLKSVERGLATEIAGDLGVEREGLDMLLRSTDTVDKTFDPDIYRAIWGVWFERETDYYEECARRVSAMSWADVVARAKGEIDERIADARAGWTRLVDAPSMPDLVRIRTLRRVGGDGKHVHLKSYSGYDPIEVAAETAEALAGVSGQTVEAVIAEHGAAGVDCPLLQRLWEFGILEDAKG